MNRFYLCWNCAISPLGPFRNFVYGIFVVLKEHGQSLSTMPRCFFFQEGHHRGIASNEITILNTYFMGKMVGAPWDGGPLIINPIYI